MATQRWILFLLPAALIAALAGCGGSTANVQNPVAPPPSNVSIAFQPEPGGSLPVSGSETVTAVVTNDSSNAGVGWTLTCQADPHNNSGLCGTLSAAHTASGSPVTYTAPATLSSSSMAVEIVAFSTYENTANVVAPITVSTFDSTFQAGTYVLQAQGIQNGVPYQFAAALTFDGNGNITNGEQTANYASVSRSDANLTGTYFVGNDGRGTITINTNDTTIGVETFTLVFLSKSQALISQMDFGSAVTGASATGTMDLQTSTTAPTDGYAFVVSGTDVVKTLPVAFGGVFNIDSALTISGTGSVTDEILGKKVNATDLGLSGTLTTPDQFGAFTLNLSAPFGTGNKAIPLQFTGYIVDSTHIKLIETDTAASNASPFAATAGLAIGQGTATGTFTSNTSFSGTYVFGVLGIDLSNSNTVPSTLTSAGLFTADGSGNLTNGFTDTFLVVNTVQGTTAAPQTGAQISAAFGGTYSVDSAGTGRASLTFDSFSPDPKHGYQPVFFFYLTGNGNPPLVLAGGDTHYPSLGAGIAYPQSTATVAFSGDYGMSFTQDQTASSENDGTAQLSANSTTTPPSLSGFADINLNISVNQDQPFTGTFSAPTATAPFSGTLLGTNNNNVNSAVFDPQIAVDYYFIDPGHGFFVETDLVTSGAQQNGQVSLGYYAARTPMCETCP
ncbi:MAG: hypothetical protein WCF68_05165 [Terriglobales bacterium]